MLSYFVHFMRAFLPLALVAGMLLPALRRSRTGEAGRRLMGAPAAGLAAGVLTYLVALKLEALTASRATLFGLGLTVALAASAVFLARRRREPGSLACWTALCSQAALAAAAMFSFLAAAGEEALSATAVLNSELILNLGGILIGFLGCAILVPVCAELAERSPSRRLSLGLFLMGLLIAVPWGADLLLALMRLERIELTSLRLSVVAKVGKYAHLAPYGELAILAALAILIWKGRSLPEHAELAALEPAPRRKTKSLILRETRWLKSALYLCVAIAAVLGFYDLYASRPPRISTPVRLTPDAAGLIRIPMAQVADGKLHRFSHLTDDGHLVRFFLINTRSAGSPGQPRIGVVFDACMLCGDMGYLQNKNEIVCIACNVRIFVPSIGKEGGCNPIPLRHEVTGSEIVISARELDKGARYFSEVVSIKVKDPVSGKELINLKAPFREEFKGRIYFFENEKTLEQFRAAPERFAGADPARNFRVQGYRQA
ncbi:hypothetical protein GMST_22090 [Geomonas silvestris]|uniref:Uncharacterized protein n=1 Tax=Geomonas silvestris TaxID=2740184 RepID=A0A6V8MIW9_9BACT|nr:Fe-S-containing protein [Geomonas silvestris]GFO59884.1 hypothetical protein GMST_22090 [Geomonas silvestris]